MTDLSPATQAVLNAAMRYEINPECYSREIAVAALRAAVDQVVPEPAMIVEGGRTYEEAWTATVHSDIRNRLLTIAAELRGQEDSNG